MACFIHLPDCSCLITPLTVISGTTINLDHSPTDLKACLCIGPDPHLCRLRGGVSSVAKALVYLFHPAAVVPEGLEHRRSPQGIGSWGDSAGASGTEDES